MRTKSEWAAIIGWLVVGQIAGHCLAPWLGPILISNYDGGWEAVFFGILLGFLIGGDVIMILLLLAIAVNFVLVKLGIIDLKKQDEEVDH